MTATGKGLVRSERGFSFILVLILMLVGTLIISAVLRYMGTGLIAAEVHQQKMGEFYAADSGLNDGLWRIKNDRLSPTYDSYDYAGTAWTYVMNDGANPVLVNGENVSVSISNEWMVKGLDAPGNAQAVIEGSGTTAPQLLVVGITDAVPTATLPGTFRIKMAASRVYLRGDK
jgi:Tfp pilus assembly protein PilX